MATVTIVNEYNVPARQLWAIVTDYQALGDIMQGLASFKGLPQGRTRIGQRMEVMVSLFGKLPKQPYLMEVVECDDTRMILRSSERGAGVKSWLHTLTVTEIATGNRLTDTIEIDAGLLTPMFALWARYVYSARHKPRLRLLQNRQT